MSGQFTGLVLFATNVIILVQKSSSLRQFVGIKDRTPVVSSMRYVGEIALLVLGLLLVVGASRAGAGARARFEQIGFGLYRRWQQFALPVRVLITGILLLIIVGWNMSQMLSVPFSYDPNWDLIAGVWRGDQEKHLDAAIQGLQSGCLLCTPGSQPIENVTNGDDIGLLFFFGVVHKLGLFPATLDGYQQFVAASFAIIIMTSAVIIGLGFRSPIAAIIVALAIVLLDTTKNFQSLLITNYWIPGGAGLLSASLGLGLLGRADQDRQMGTKPTYGFYYAVFGFWGLAAGLAYLGRSAAGPITLGSALVALLILMMRLRPVIRWLPALGLLVAGFAVIYASFQFALTWRVTYYHITAPSPANLSSHAFSHAILLGMGYVTNDEGLMWDDGIGAILAEKECPGVVFLTPDYYNCVRNIVIKVILNDPNLMIRSILAKLEATIQVTFIFFPYALYALIGLYLIRKPAYYVFLGSLLAFNVAPGLLTMPYPSYLQGYFQIFVIAAAAGIILLSNRLAAHFDGETYLSEGR
jgi:hypothetical protein